MALLRAGNQDEKYMVHFTTRVHPWPKPLRALKNTIVALWNNCSPEKTDSQVISQGQCIRVFREPMLSLWGRYFKQGSFSCIFTFITSSRIKQHKRHRHISRDAFGVLWRKLRTAQSPQIKDGSTIKLRIRVYEDSFLNESEPANWSRAP